MTLETAMLPIFLTAIAGVVLWNVIGAKGHWSIKAIVMSFVSSLCLWVWVSIGAMMGWPVDKTPTGTYDIGSTLVVEPNRSKSIEGAIYVWIYNMDKMDDHDLFQQQEQHMSQRKPRSYGLPYSRELHDQINEIQKQRDKGSRVRVTIKPKVDGPKGKKGGVEQEPNIKFHVLPPSKVPKSIGVPRERNQIPKVPETPNFGKGVEL
jgi:hypothetical protein